MLNQSVKGRGLLSVELNDDCDLIILLFRKNLGDMQMDMSYSIYNYKGELLDDNTHFELGGSYISPTYNYLAVVVNNYIMINKEVDGKTLFGFMDTKGKIEIEPQFQMGDNYFDNSIRFYTDGYAVLNIDGKYGVIDSKGNVVIDFQYDAVQTKYNLSKNQTSVPT